MTDSFTTEDLGATKFVSEPKEIYSLNIENLSTLTEYKPDSKNPDSLISKVSLSAGSLFIPITVATEAPRRWSTMQVSKNKHVELNSALLFLNHSCNPSLEIDTSTMEIRVAKAKNLNIGDELTFFYPSTEWEMDKPFSCLCGAESRCLGIVTGAADIPTEKLSEWFINEHIVKLKTAQMTETQ